MNGERLRYQNLPQQDNELQEGSQLHFHSLFACFLHNFSRENIRIYHRQISRQVVGAKSVLSIELSDLKGFDDNLYEQLMASPLEKLRAMETVAREYARQRRGGEFPDSGRKDKKEEVVELNWQVVLTSDQHPIRLRQLHSGLVHRLIVVSGIIISATKPYIKASKLRLRCRGCLALKEVDLMPGQSPYLPIYCDGQGQTNQKCPPDPFVALPDSEVIDAQSMRIQESPEDVPTGEIARTYNLVADRANVGKCVPGDRVRITGIMLVHDLKTENLSKGYLLVIGTEKLKERTKLQYSEQEEEIFKSMSRDPAIRSKISQAIAPGIFGSNDVKRAIACLLFGGSRKHLPDQTVLRGDINVLLIGDPSTAKSQFLKFVEQTAPISVYTSGKGSSAAGLTASITKDATTGEFQIQGGALVLADGGIVCIDEFDKMKPQDRVAIHEAMEQQTISVAKAGITTRLNSRAAVLAAANPIYGRYDELKQVGEQIELQTTILSRFDCIFIVRDLNTAENNARIASHILNLHQGRITRETQANELPFELLKKYIRYAKAKVNPRLSALAAEKLQRLYVADRAKANEQKQLTHSRNCIPITVRQLEAVIRISESLARMKLRHEVTPQEVDEAHELFELSTLKAIEGKQFGYELGEGVADEVAKAEEAIRKRVCIGSQVAISKVMEQMHGRFGEASTAYALRNLVTCGDFREIKGKRQVLRQK